MPPKAKVAPKAEASRKAKAAPKAKSASTAGSADEQEFRRKFRQLDADRNGTLSFEEMYNFMKALNPAFSENQLQQLFVQIDVNRNGVVEMNEFFDYLLDGKKSTVADAFEPPQGSPSAGSVREQWKEQTLAAHNHLRAPHGVGALTWSDECYISAKKQADICQEKGGMLHGTCEGPSGRHGQNIFWCSRPGSSPWRCTKSWYDEITDPGYDFSKPGFTHGIGHFTQAVWKGTTSVGMATSEDGRFVVANYYPAGNYMGQFPANVLNRSPPYDMSTQQPPAACAGAVDYIADGARPARVTPATRTTAAPPRPKETARPKAESPTAGSTPVSAGGGTMTPEITAALAGCPFPFEAKIKTAFAEGGTVSVERSEKGGMTSLKVCIKKGGCTSTMTGSWGGG